MNHLISPPSKISTPTLFHGGRGHIVTSPLPPLNAPGGRAISGVPEGNQYHLFFGEKKREKESLGRRGERTTTHPSPSPNLRQEKKKERLINRECSSHPHAKAECRKKGKRGGGGLKLFG